MTAPPLPPLISSDGHLEVRPERWSPRMPPKHRDKAPRTIKLPDGGDAILVEGQPPYPAPFLDLRAGRTNETWSPLGVTVDDTAVPAAIQVSSEATATTDDLCTFSGTQASGANFDYQGVLFAGDLVTPTSSSYIYRLPGADGVCNTADDVIHLVHPNMGTADAPVVGLAMPITAISSSTGALTGYTFQEVLAIPRLTATELVRYLDSVIGPLAQRLRALPDDEAAGRAVRRATGILQGCFGHIGEIDALLAIRERSAQRASA